MTVPYYERTLDSFADHIITQCTDKASPSGCYNATLDTGPQRYVSDPDFAPYGYGRTREEAIAKCAAAIRADAKGIGKFAPHGCLKGYDFHWRLAKHWAEKELTDTNQKPEPSHSLGEPNMSLPEKNTFFENLPAHADVRLQGPKGSQAYIHTDADGVESVVIMDGQQQREQQQTLDQLCEETIGRKLYAKGYRYKCNPTSRKFDPLYVKTSTEIGPLLRTYPDERFDVHEINERGETLHRADPLLCR